MPPADKGVEQPSHAEVRQSFLANEPASLLEDYDNSGQTVLHMNRANTATPCATLSLEHLTVDPTNFPADNPMWFHKPRGSLNPSDAHLAQYLSAADEYLEMAHLGNTTCENSSYGRLGLPKSKNVTPWMYRLPVRNILISERAASAVGQIYLATYPRTLPIEAVFGMRLLRYSCFCRSHSRLTHL